MEELQMIGNLSKGRKSQHTIPEEDIMNLEEFMKKEGEKRRKESENNLEEISLPKTFSHIEEDKEI